MSGFLCSNPVTLPSFDATKVYPCLTEHQNYNVRHSTGDQKNGLSFNTITVHEPGGNCAHQGSSHTPVPPRDSSGEEDSNTPRTWLFSNVQSPSDCLSLSNSSLFSKIRRGRKCKETKHFMLPISLKFLSFLQS